jgi:hypothetical protein
VSRYSLVSMTVFALGCASSTTSRTTSTSLTASACGGYEDILALADRPLTPCEVDTQTNYLRELPSQWPTPYSGPCQFVDVQVVVDTLGRLEPGSPSVVRTNAPQVANNLIEQMRTAQFRPGRKSGVPVRQVRRYHFASPNAIGRCDR